MTTETVERVCDELEKQAERVPPGNRAAGFVLYGIAAALRAVLTDYPAGEIHEF